MTQYLQKTLEPLSAWRGRDLADTDDWIISLDIDHIKELTAAMVANEQQGTDPFHISADDFPLPTVSQICRRIQSDLEGGRGFALIRVLPVARYSLDQNALIFWGLGTHLGMAETQDRAGNLLHHVRDTGEDLSNDNVRAYQTRGAIGYHNDGADVFMLLCLKTAGCGGRTKLVSGVSVFNEILRRKPDLTTVLQEPFYFDLRGQQRQDQAPYQSVPIYNFHDGNLCVLYKREYIDLAQRFPQVPTLTERQIAALDLLDKICDECALEFEMRPGDILAANNYDCLHARSAYQENPVHNQNRHMLRIWLTLPNGRALPPVFATTREFCHSFARRQAYRE